MQPVITQLGRFLVVGVSNSLLSFLVYRVLLVAHVHYIVSAPLAFAVGAVNGYLLNRRWTFRAADSRSARIRYVLVQVAGALATTVLVLLFVRVADNGRALAYLLAIPPVTLATFFANRAWTFASRS
jgi:putative flippase GtrA